MHTSFPQKHQLYLQATLSFQHIYAPPYVTTVTVNLFLLLIQTNCDRLISREIKRWRARVGREPALSARRTLIVTDGNCVDACVCVRLCALLKGLQNVRISGIRIDFSVYDFVFFFLIWASPDIINLPSMCMNCCCRFIFLFSFNCTLLKI